MTSRTQVKRGLRRVIQTDDVNGPAGPALHAANTAALLQLDQLLQAAAPEDRIEVFRIEGYETFERMREQGTTDEEARSSLSVFANDRQHLWNPEADIAEIIRDVTEVSDPIPFGDDADMAKPRDGSSNGLHPSSSALPPLTLSEWDARDLPTPDFLLGSMLSTTNRVLISAETGIGKSNLAIGIGFRVAAGERFLHWEGSGKPRKVLYVDGEMSRRLLRLRLRSEIQRLGSSPQTFFALCAEDIDDFKPLNTEDGQVCLRNIIKRLGGVDLIIFDNIMSLVAGSMVDELSWAEVMPFVRSLTRQNIGQIWVHHTGHNEKRAYGTKTREWGMDTVAVLEQVKRPDTDVSFKMTFPKARERAPSNRSDFREIEIALVDDAWVYAADAGADASEVKKISPTASKFLDVLKQAIAASGDLTVDTQDWIAACGRAGLVNPEGKPNAVRALFYKYRAQLVTAGRVGIEDDRSWLIA